MHLDGCRFRKNIRIYDPKDIQAIYTAIMPTIVDRFKDAGVPQTTLLQIWGAILYVAVLALYAVSLDNATGWQHDAWIALIVLHLVEAVLVFFEAIYFMGETWWYSQFVIGNALVITFYAAVLHIVSVVENLLEDTPWNNTLVAASGAAIITALLANSAMVAVLWSYFHKTSKTKISSRAGYTYVSQ